MPRTASLAELVVPGQTTGRLNGPFRLLRHRRFHSGCNTPWTCLEATNPLDGAPPCQACSKTLRRSAAGAWRVLRPPPGRVNRCNSTTEAWPELCSMDHGMCMRP